jgi:cytochrome oxidase Cu insertion factor (SCO1/SenC/PrrC family)
MKQNSRSKFLVVVGVFVVPVIAAYLAYFGWRPAGHTNYGNLLKTTPLQQTQGSLLDGTPYALNALLGSWVMVHVGSSQCDEACAHQLYLMRQLRITQGKDQSRIERLWVVTDRGTPDKQMTQAHPGLKIWHPDNATFVDQFPAPRDRSAHIYLIDPLGNLMLRFPENPNPKGIMKDLKLLLKASQIG